MALANAEGALITAIYDELLNQFVGPPPPAPPPAPPTTPEQGLQRIANAVGKAVIDTLNLGLEISILYTQVADSAAIANTLVETAFSKTFTIPGNTLGVGDVLRIRASGVYSTAGVAPNLTLRIRIGAQGTNATTIAALAGQAGNAWRIEADTTLRTFGAAGNFEGGGGLVSILTASGIGVPSNTVSDMTGNLVVDVTATWSIADAGDTITMQTLTVELLRAGTVN
jgi:hypothetical protein